VLIKVKLPSPGISMKIVVPTLTVDIEDGFTNDLLNREYFGESLYSLITRSTDELVIALDGKWGEGKSTFVKMWQGLLRKNGVPSIYIDAFQSDYTEDAFISIAGAITNYVESNSSNKKEKTDFKEKAKKVGVRLLAWSAKIGVKAATLGAIQDTEISALNDIKEDIAKNVSDELEELVKERLNTHSKEVELIQSFRSSLSEIPATLNGNESNRLVIIIDELDRCKPTFSVEILEKIKHLFSVKNIVFLLVMNKNQLEESIKSVYGQNIDSHTYLQKFINVEVNLPKQSTDRYKNDIDIYSSKLLELHEIETWGEDRNILETLKPLAKHFNLSLIELEKVFTNISIIYASSKSNHLRLIPIILLISILKVIKPHIFQKLLNNSINYSELCSAINYNEHNDIGNNQDLSFTMTWVKHCILTDSEYQALESNDRVKQMGSALWNYNISRDKVISFFCEQLSLIRVL
jgi:hypothetical protein